MSGWTQILVVVALIAATSALLPMPGWLLWQLRYAAIEVRGLTLLLAVVGLMTALSQGSRGLSVAAVLAVVLAAPPLLRSWQLAHSRGVPLSAWQYLTGRVAPSASVESDLQPDPHRPELLLDLRRGGPAWVLVVHGGSWQRGDKGEVPHVSDALVAAGYTVLDLRYRLAPEHPFPAAVQDVTHVLGVLPTIAGELGIDPSRGALLGRSAGGQLALSAAQRSDVRAVVSLYAPVDLAWGYDHPFVPDVIDGPAQLRTYLGGSPVERAEAYALASPHLQVSDRSPPALLIHGQDDRLVRADHAAFMEQAMIRVGRPAERLLIPGAEHGFDVRPGGSGEQIAREAILRFLRRWSPPE